MSDEKPEKRVFAQPDSGIHVVNAAGKLHSFDDAPAFVYGDGTRWWYRDGTLHRDNGPAVVWWNGVEEWYQNGERHREGAPAVTFPVSDSVVPELRGVQQFWSRGRMIREDAPPHIAAYRRDLAALRKKHFGG